MAEGRKRQSSPIAGAGIFLLAVFASQCLCAQTNAQRVDAITFEYNGDSNYLGGGISQFLTSSWGPLYWIAGGETDISAAVLEQDTGGGSSVNVGALNGQVTGRGGFVYLAGMVNGADGAIWLAGGYYNSTTDCGDEIFRLDSAGNVSIYSLGTCSSTPGGITAGSDGALWFTQMSTGQIGRITTAGIVTEFTTPCGVETNGTYSSILQGPIISGSDGNLWFWCSATSSSTSPIYKLTPSGQFTAYSLPINYKPYAQGDSGFTLGPDGSIWFPAVGPATRSSNYYVGSISPSGAMNFYSLPASGPGGVLTYIPGIVAGPDGAIWTSAYYDSATGSTPPSAFLRVTTAGQVSFVPIVPDPSFADFLCQPAGASAIGLGPNETIVFASGTYSANQACYLGRLRPGASSLWPGTATTVAPATTRALAKASRAVNKAVARPADGGSGALWSCPPGAGCDLSVWPKNPGLAMSCEPDAVKFCDFADVAPIITVRYSSYESGILVVGLGIGTDPSHQYGTCAGYGANTGQMVQFEPQITPDPKKSVTLAPGHAGATIALMADRQVTLIAPSSCTFPSRH